MLGQFPLVYLFFLPLWETARYRLKYCLKGPLNLKQPKTTNQPTYMACGPLNVYPFTCVLPSFADQKTRKARSSKPSIKLDQLLDRLVHDFPDCYSTLPSPYSTTQDSCMTSTRQHPNLFSIIRQDIYSTSHGVPGQIDLVVQDSWRS